MFRTNENVYAPLTAGVGVLSGDFAQRADKLKAAGKGNNIDGSKPYLMVEAKLISSKTGKPMGEGVYLISSEQFRREVDSPEKFQLLANQWVRGAISVASGLR